MIESILTSIKKLLGITAEYEHFDADLIMCINSALMILNQLGVGPENGFRITGSTETWNDFVSNEKYLDLIKSYIHLKVRLMFDTSSLTSAVIEAINRQISEYEFRLAVAAESVGGEQNG